MRGVKVLLSLILLVAAPYPGLGAAAAPAQGPAQQPGRLRVVVLDPSGAIIPGALVSLQGAEGRNRNITHPDVATDAQGVATFDGLPPGKYNFQVLFEGFEPVGVMNLSLKAGETFRREVTLPIKALEESVSVGRDPKTNASDPNNGRLDTTLSKDQINALPDDPDEMQKVLEELAGPGATIRVDGFRGGRLPPKEQIRSIRINRDPFSAENHGAGVVFVDIVTQPGIGPMRGGMNFSFSDDALNARTASQPTKPEQRNQMVGFNLSGTIVKNKTSYNLGGMVSDNYNGSEVFARTLDGDVRFSFKQPSQMFSFNGRVDHAISKSHTVRASLNGMSNEMNGGVGGFSLREQGTRNKTQNAFLRLSDTGPWGKKLFNETRLQIGFASQDSSADIEGQTIRVLDAFTGGGAQTRGGRDEVSLEIASNVDYVWKKHSIRFGGIVEGWMVETDQQSNYLGTFTFASLADYAAGRPTTFSIREGDPFVEYSQFQYGLFVQDDWRARPNLTVSFGVRQEMQSNLDDKINLNPRVGLTWAPGRQGRTTVRASAGLFSDWLTSPVYGQVLQVDGARQRETIIRNPGYPNPYVGGQLMDALPLGRYELADDLSMPWSFRTSLGLSQALPIKNLGLNLQYFFMRGYDQFRGRNINAPVNGVRPNPAFGNITQVESTGRSRSHSVHAGLNYSTSTGIGFIGRTFFFVNYSYNNTMNDFTGPFGLPADNYNLEAEWGPASGMSRHSIGPNISTVLWKKINIGLNMNFRSGTPYTITTGFDDNADGVSNDRPAGVGRNTEWGEWTFRVGGSLSYSLNFGRRPGEGGAGGTTVIMGGAGPVMMGGSGNGRYNVNLFVNFNNLLNNVNPRGYSGVMTSPLFRQATGTEAARSVNIGARIGF